MLRIYQDSLQIGWFEKASAIVTISCPVLQAVYGLPPDTNEQQIMLFSTGSALVSTTQLSNAITARNGGCGKCPLLGASFRCKNRSSAKTSSGQI
jgi:hypothetical protein